ncbi:non-ribosomal peptide synthetase [Streptomyces albiaxialis]|uniref:Non-ribosomal peptide synthetase n=1 Tax=Streptomyces albiaxialis TaxID=329523 RepID=A0ABP5IIM5_9ACTN
MTAHQQAAAHAPEASGLSRLLSDAADRHPGNGIRFGSGSPGAPCTYPELLEKALRLLAGLRESGAEPGRPVVALLHEPADFVPVFWACVLGGMPMCPMSTGSGDARDPAERLGEVTGLLDAPLTVTTEALSRPLAGAGGRVVALERLSAGPSGDGLPDPGPSPAAPEDPALFLLTSGSTGVPKAVRLTHANLLASMRAKAGLLALSERDTAFNWVSFDHVAAWEGHLLPLAVGAAQVQTAPESVMADPLEWLRTIDAHRVSLTFTPNFLLGEINTALDSRTSPLDADLSCVRHILSGGEANPVATGVAFLEKLAPSGLGGNVLHPAFGMTETCAGSIVNVEFPERDRGAETAAVGRPVNGLELRVVNEANLPVAEGQMGEVQVRGPMVTGGYENNAAATEGAFTDDGWFRTGDLGRLDDGRLTLVGRSKDTVIVNGVSYSGRAMEAVVREVPGVDETHVAAFAVCPPGSDTEKLAVLFGSTLADESENGLHDLVTAVRGAVVRRWGFRPDIVLPLPRSAFPRTSLGKVQRSRLRERLRNGEFDERRAEVDALLGRMAEERTPPRGGTESTIVDVFAEIFPEDAAAIGATTNFFDLGGTSLDILRLSRLIDQRFHGTSVPLSTLMTAPTPRALAGLVEGERTRARTAYDPVVPLQTTGGRTPLFCVHPGVGEVLVFVNLAKYFAGDRPFYALRAPGFHPGERPFGTFAEMASVYTEAIRARQPHGPYAIAGYSFGAAVAFEIAKILEADGEEVRFLGNFNLPPHIRQRMNELDFAETAVNLAMFLELIGEEQAESIPPRIRELPEHEQIATLLRSAAPERSAQLGLDQRQFTEWARLASHLTGLGRTYEPSGSVRAMSVFCADPLHGTREEWVRKLHGWNAFTDEPNRFIDVPGEHYTLMGPTHVPTFQEILRVEIGRAMGDG